MTEPAYRSAILFEDFLELPPIKKIAAIVRSSEYKGLHKKHYGDMVDTLRALAAYPAQVGVPLVNLECEDRDKIDVKRAELYYANVFLVSRSLKIYRHDRLHVRPLALHTRMQKDNEASFYLRCLPVAYRADRLRAREIERSGILPTFIERPTLCSSQFAIIWNYILESEKDLPRFGNAVPVYVPERENERSVSGFLMGLAHPINNTDLFRPVYAWELEKLESQAAVHKSISPSSASSFPFSQKEQPFLPLAQQFKSAASHFNLDPSLLSCVLNSAVSASPNVTVRPRPTTTPKDNRDYVVRNKKPGWMPSYDVHFTSYGDRRSMSVPMQALAGQMFDILQGDHCQDVMQTIHSLYLVGADIGRILADVEKGRGSEEETLGAAKSFETFLRAMRQVVQGDAYRRVVDIYIERKTGLPERQPETGFRPRSNEDPNSTPKR
jgi:hypothetical protein